MKFSQMLAPIAGLVSVAVAGGYEETVWTTVVTTAYETYCPYPTTFAWYNVTYTATSDETVTITNCPCTITYSPLPPVTTTYVYPNTTSTITYVPEPSTYISGTTPITYPTNTPVGPSTTGPVTIPTAAAGKVGPIGALIAAGLAAMAL